MIVGITMRITPSSYGEQRDAISHDWFRRMIPLGADLILIPNTYDDPACFAMRHGVDRLLLTGGEDLGALDGEPGGPALTMRDQSEFSLLKWAFDSGVPTLAVCRGLQISNVYLGGGITRSLEKSVPWEKHRASEHLVMLSGGKLMPVNSYHDQGILVDQIAPDLEIFARSSGGVVEGFRHRSKPLVAIQWHPERPTPDSGFDDALLLDWLENRQ